MVAGGRNHQTATCPKHENGLILGTFADLGHLWIACLLRQKHKKVTVAALLCFSAFQNFP